MVRLQGTTSSLNGQAAGRRRRRLGRRLTAPSAATGLAEPIPGYRRWAPCRRRAGFPDSPATLGPTSNPASVWLGIAFPTKRSMAVSWARSSGAASEIALPLEPALAVRPIRCT